MVDVTKRNNTVKTCGDGTILYLDYGGGYMKLHVTKLH